MQDSVRFARVVREAFQSISAFVACSAWGIDVLRRNGANHNRIVPIPQGVSRLFLEPGLHTDRKGGPRKRATAPFRVAYVGRIAEVKGVHILVEAFRRVEAPEARLYLVGMPQTGRGGAYVERIRALARGDSRIILVGKKPAHRLKTLYRAFDLVAVPSIWPETGPLVLLEALACGTPVWTSARIGHLGLVRDFGRVIEPNTVEEWAGALQEAAACHRAGRRPSLPRPVPVPTMAMTAERMLDLYRRLGSTGTGTSGRKDL